MLGWQVPAVVAAAALGLTAGIWLGYPALTITAARLAGRAPGNRTADASRPAALPSVTAVIATRDTPALLAERVANLHDTAYPADRLDVVIAVDPGGAWEPDAYRAVLPADVRVVPGDTPGGKAAALNAGVRAATGDVLVFADSAQAFTRDTIPALVARLNGDPSLGAVSGLIVQPDSGDGVMDGFWEFEVGLRRAQERLHSIICVSGAVYALRRALWRPMPAGLICDDLFVTMHVAGAGLRVALAPEARAIDARKFTRGEHFARKVRTQVGLLQLLTWCPWVLRPGRNPMWAHLLGHKVLRVVTPALLAVAAVAGLVAVTAFAGLTVLLLLAALAVAAGAAAYAARPRAVRGVADRFVWLVRLQAAPMIACVRALRGDWNVWRPVRRSEEPT